MDQQKPLKHNLEYLEWETLNRNNQLSIRMRQKYQKHHQLKISMSLLTNK